MIPDFYGDIRTRRVIFCKMNMLKCVFTIFLFLSFSHFLWAQHEADDSVNISLNQAWVRADEFCKELQLKKIETQISQEQIQDARRSRLPKIEAEAMYGVLSNIPVFVDGIANDPEYIPIEDHSTYDIGIQAYFNLYDGKKVKIAIDKATTRKEMQEHIADATSSEIHYEVAQYYLDIIRSNEFKKIIEQNISQNTKRLMQITQLYENGVVLKSDLLRAQLQLSQQETNLQSIKNNIEITTQKLNMLLGYDDNCQLQLTDSISILLNDSGKQYSDYVEQSLKESPLVKMAQSQIALSELEQKEIRAEKLPKIELFGEYTYSYPQIMLYPYVTAPYLLGVGGIKLSYNISSLYSNKYKESVAALVVQKQVVAKENTDEALRSKINTSYKKYQEDKANIEVDKISIQQAEENYRIVNQTYFNKLALITDLLEADSQLLQAKFSLVSHTIAARLHYYQLLKTSGLL